MKKMEKGEYTDAASIFSGLGKYNGADELMQECTFEAAMVKIKEGDYVKAANLFEELGHYNDADQLYQKCEKVNKYQQIQECYIDATPGDKVVFEEGGAECTCICVTDDEVALICDFSYGPMMYKDVKNFLNNSKKILTFFPREFQEFYVLDQDNSLTILTEQEIT